MCLSSPQCPQDCEIHQHAAPGAGSSETVEETRLGSQRLFVRMGRAGALLRKADELTPRLTEGWIALRDLETCHSLSFTVDPLLKTWG